MTDKKYIRMPEQMFWGTMSAVRFSLDLDNPKRGKNWRPSLRVMHLKNKGSYENRNFEKPSQKEGGFATFNLGEMQQISEFLNSIDFSDVKDKRRWSAIHTWKEKSTHFSFTKYMKEDKDKGIKKWGVWFNMGDDRNAGIVNVDKKNSETGIYEPQIRNYSLFKRFLDKGIDKILMSPPATRSKGDSGTSSSSSSSKSDDDEPLPFDDESWDNDYDDTIGV